MKVEQDTMAEKKLLSLKTVIRTKDFNASKDFYTNIPKLEIIEEYEEKGAKGCIVKLGSEPNNAFIEISEIAKGDDYFQESFAKDSKTDKVDLQILTDDVNYWATRLKKYNWQTRDPVLPPWGFHYLYLRDPDNLQIIIYEE
jgi:catechol 2,3-dioxygenase-like lactoylglutathione lyase family enzyme